MPLEEEVFYPAFLELSTIKWEWFLDVIHRSLTTAFRSLPTSSNDDTYLEGIKEFIRQLQTTLGVDLLASMYDRLPYIEDMLDSYPEQKYSVASQIATVKNLYHAIDAIGLIDYFDNRRNNRVETDKEKLRNAFNEFMRCLLLQKICAFEHDMVMKMIDDDTATQVAVLSIGSGNNPQEVAPAFCKTLAEDQVVTVYNIDYALASQEMDKLQEELSKRTTANINIKLLDMRILLPTIKYASVLNTSFHMADQINDCKEFKSFKTNLDYKIEELLKRYVQVLLAKKKANPLFKVVIMYSCSAGFTEELKNLASMLLKDGNFKLGEDLELVHAYFEHSPAVIYRDINTIPDVNEILGKTLPGMQVEKSYDAAANMYVFPSADAITRLFVANPLEPDESSSLSSDLGRLRLRRGL